LFELLSILIPGTTTSCELVGKGKGNGAIQFLFLFLVARLRQALPWFGTFGKLHSLDILERYLSAVLTFLSTIFALIVFSFIARVVSHKTVVASCSLTERSQILHDNFCRDCLACSTYSTDKNRLICVNRGWIFY
jgi:hypothetical protein